MTRREDERPGVGVGSPRSGGGRGSGVPVREDERPGVGVGSPRSGGGRGSGVPVREEEWDRWVSMEGCANFRDAGGYPTANGRTVRTGTLYRSGSPARMTERDIALARDELGIKTVVDLRAEAEALEGGSAPFTESCGVDIVAIPMGRGIKGGTEGLPDLTTPSALGPLYIFHAQNGPEQIVEAVSLIASRCRDPLVVHCAGGKDRTGMVIALVLDILGVDHETIVEDYALTELNLARIPDEHLAALARQMGKLGWSEAILHAVPDSMRAFLDWLRTEHGSAESFLVSQGCGSDTADALRERLLVRQDSSKPRHYSRP